MDDWLAIDVVDEGHQRSLSSCLELTRIWRKGNWRALKLLVDILQDIERRAEPQTEESSFGLADEKVIAQLMARFSKSQKL